MEEGGRGRPGGRLGLGPLDLGYFPLLSLDPDESSAQSQRSPAPETNRPAHDARSGFATFAWRGVQDFLYVGYYVIWDERKRLAHMEAWMASY
ncbi:hypothetical protein HYQ46_012927 [Verticillium longisporum]|nr:hypothetical protein HYQ46_012927 [Verticillium longisporum]